jgi:hypothetical protein
MRDEATAAQDWRVVLVMTAGPCRICGEVIPVGVRAWYLRGQGLQHLDCPTEPAGAAPGAP